MTNRARLYYAVAVAAVGIMYGVVFFRILGGW